MQALEDLYEQNAGTFLAEKEYQKFFDENGHWLVPYAAAPLAAAVNRLLADSAAARAMGAAGRRRVAAYYTVERMVHETEAVYRYLIASGRAARDRPLEVG